MCQRRAGGQHQRCEARPRYLAQISGDESSAGGFGQFVDTIVTGNHLGAAPFKRVAARQPGAAEPEHRYCLSRKGSDRGHDLKSVIPAKEEWSALNTLTAI